MSHELRSSRSSDLTKATNSALTSCSFIACRPCRKQIDRKLMKQEAWLTLAQDFVNEHSEFGYCKRHGQMNSQAGGCAPCNRAEEKRLKEERKKAKALDGQMCVARVRGDWHSSPCGSPAKVKFDADALPPELKKVMPKDGGIRDDYRPGAYYCGVHDPVKRLQKEKATRDRWAEEDRLRAVRDRQQREERGMVRSHDILHAALAEIAGGRRSAESAREIAQTAIEQTAKIMERERNRSWLDDSD